MSSGAVASGPVDHPEKDRPATSLTRSSTDRGLKTYWLWSWSRDLVLDLSFESSSRSTIRYCYSSRGLVSVAAYVKLGVQHNAVSISAAPHYGNGLVSQRESSSLVMVARGDPLVPTKSVSL